MLDLYKRVKCLEHKLNNVISFGTIKEVDTATNKVVVQIGSMETPPINYLINASGSAKVYFYPQVADSVMVISKNGCISSNSSICLPNVYKEVLNIEQNDWSLEFASGSILYKAGKLEIKCEGEVTIDSKKATIKAEQIILGYDSGGEVVCKNHTCSFTGTPQTRKFKNKRSNVTMNYLAKSITIVQRVAMNVQNIAIFKLIINFKVVLISVISLLKFATSSEAAIAYSSEILACFKALYNFDEIIVIFNLHLQLSK